MEKSEGGRETLERSGDGVSQAWRPGRPVQRHQVLDRSKRLWGPPSGTRMFFLQTVTVAWSMLAIEASLLS